MAIKKLQTELKEEKRADLERCGILPKFTTPIIHDVPCRRRNITIERKKAVEERRRLEDEKAKVPTITFI
jgi:hypothetical protein